MSGLERLSFVVAGEAIPQGSAKAFVVKGRAVITTDNPRLKEWRQKVVDAAELAMTDGGFGDQPVAVSLWFRFVRPESVKAAARPWPSVRPDVDKLARAVLDALTTSGVVSDDSRVVDLRAVKVYAEAESVSVLVVPAGGPQGVMKGSI